MKTVRLNKKDGKKIVDAHLKDTKETKALVKQQASLQGKIEVLQVTTPETYKTAMELAVAVKEFKREVERVFRFQEQKDALNRAKAIVLEQEHKYMDPLDVAEAAIKDKMSDYELNKELRREEEAERERRAAEEAAERERRALLARADRTKDPGKAEALREQAARVTATPVIPDKAVNKIEGVSSADGLEIVVTDGRAFLEHVFSVAAALEPLLTFKIGGVKAFVKSFGLRECPGLVIKRRKIISVKEGA